MKRRFLQRHIEAALADTPVILLHGARQTGKTTLVRALADETHRRYLTLDDAILLGLASENPAGFIDGLRGPVVLDEIQRAPGLFLAIKKSVDENRAPGRFLLTGSANVLALPKLSESLAGRMEILRLFPFSVGEQLGHQSTFVDDAFTSGALEDRRVATSRPDTSRPDTNRADTNHPGTDILGASDLDSSRTSGDENTDSVWDWIVKGGFPEAAERTDPSRRHAWFGSYVTTILQRDVREISNIENLSSVPRLLSLLAGRVSGLLNVSDVSRALGIPHTTLKRYIALLEATFMIRLLPAWATNLGLRLVKSPKLHFVDTGLACSLLGVDRERVESDPLLRGSMLESFVALELTKQASWSETQPSLYHFRTTAGSEVDFVMEGRDGTIVGIEVKSSANVRSSDFAGLRKLREIAGERFRRGVVVHTGRESAQTEADLVAVPVARLWQG
ncbi:MAG: ATP-binding protein [Candidatus Eisenbacteria bacterium]|uniref:ATP-binding protein n=1 Tax=Eiseniibacteriota bacterium TaxID=2212470 RepID=A0A956SFJ0_UNCEI|nr:ATP-binding protein [Candidatus Eisenbacteria bacterium]MCB9466459.1 ATP-binding protein [Candidatus Eisenbacteria bacterium]